MSATSTSQVSAVELCPGPPGPKGVAERHSWGSGVSIDIHLGVFDFEGKTPYVLFQHRVVGGIQDTVTRSRIVLLSSVIAIVLFCLLQMQLLSTV